MQIVKEIYLDFYQSEPVLVTAKQGDVGRYLKVTLLDNGNIFTVPSGATATFSRDDVWNGCTVNDDGTILAPITADMRPGKVPAQIEISSGSDHLSSWNFILDVQFSARNDDAIEGDNDFSALNMLLDQVQTAINNTNEAIANVNAAIADMGTNFTSLANNQSISQLATNSKTLVGGINELNSNSYLLQGGTSIPNNADLNDYTTVGNYYCNNNAIAESLQNAPFSTAFTLKIEQATGTPEFPCQTARNYQTGVKAWREYNKYSEAWTNWAYFSDDATIFAGTSIKSRDDLNDYKTPGIYKSVSSSQTATILNLPETIQSGFILLVFSASQTANVQLLLPTAGGVKMYYRGLTTQGWQPWMVYQGNTIS